MSPPSRAERLKERLSINPDEQPQQPSTSAQRPASRAEPAAAEPVAPAGQPPAPEHTGHATSRPSAVEDPAITPGKKDYRSFYVEDAVFARFRAAVYWLSRREDAADDVPESMSAGIEALMEQTAHDLEQRYNQGNVFRAPPDTRRRGRRRPTT